MALPPLFVVVDADASPVAGELVASKFADAPVALPAVPSAAAAAVAAAVAAAAGIFRAYPVDSQDFYYLVLLRFLIVLSTVLIDYLITMTTTT